METKKPFVRRPRPSKLKKIVLDYSSSEESDSTESDEVAAVENFYDKTLESDLSTNREVIEYLSIKNGKSPNKENQIILPSLDESPMGKLLYIIEEGKQSEIGVYRTKVNTTVNENFSNENSIKPEISFKEQMYNKKRSRRTMSPIKSAVSQANLINKTPTLYSRQRSFNHPLRMVPGPDPMPCRPLKYHHDDIDVKKSYYDTYSYDNTNFLPLTTDHDFRLNDFLCDESTEVITRRFDASSTNKDFKLVSKRNYNKICKLLEEKIAEEMSDQDDEDNYIHVQTIAPEIKPFEHRKPKRQTMIEMANYLKNELAKDNGLTKPKSKLTDDSSSIRSSKRGKKQLDEEDEVTPTQLAIVDSLLQNGTSLSLKGHFLDQLPDMDSLKRTLIYFNISFNNFNEVPIQVLNMYQLEVLKMRNNPIKHLTDKLINLQSLKLLSISYCQLGSIPSCIFELENLVHLDVSYNRIPSINVDIIKLRKLKSLNYEGNEIEYLPSCMLKMKRLQHINVKNNYLHPLIWQRLMCNQSIPSLFSIAAARVDHLYGEDSNEIEKLQHNYSIPTSHVQNKLRGYEIYFILFIQFNNQNK